MGYPVGRSILKKNCNLTLGRAGIAKRDRAYKPIRSILDRRLKELKTSIW
ncbi:MAG: hypothetical protein J7L17_02880 [Thaumarchaeota archaeon]|nr:hypothetical protein [Nitrososphaerota archaeon]